MCGRNASLILDPPGGLSGLLALHCGSLVHSEQYLKFGFPPTILREVCFFYFPDRMYVVKQASSLQVFGCCVCARIQKCENQWTLLNNFNFLHHPQILPCLKAINKYRNVHTYLHMLCTLYVCMRVLITPFGCILDISLLIVPSFGKIWLHLAKLWGFVDCTKLSAYFHLLCMHTHTCMPTNIINQLRRPISTYAKIFANIWQRYKHTHTYEHTHTAQIYIIWVRVYLSIIYYDCWCLKKPEKTAKYRLNWGMEMEICVYCRI